MILLSLVLLLCTFHLHPGPYPFASPFLSAAQQRPLLRLPLIGSPLSFRTLSLVVITPNLVHDFINSRTLSLS